MIDETEENVGESKKINKRGRTFFNTNHQTFTKLTNAVLKFISQINLKRDQNRSILGGILTRLFANLNWFLILNNYGLRMKKRKSGYVLILTLVLLPILLFGAKWIWDTRTAQYVSSSVVQNSLLSEASNTYKHCAKEVSLAVAKNWNPGLTLGQQRDGIYKVADAVYNAAPAYSNTSTKYEAVPGMDVPTKVNVRKGKTFDPLKATLTPIKSLSADVKTVGYSAVTVYNCRWSVSPSYWNGLCGLWLGIDKGSDSANRIGFFDEIERFNESKATKKQKEEFFIGSKNYSLGNYVLKHHDIYANPHIYSCQVGSPTDYNYNNGLPQIYYEVLSTETSYVGMEEYSLYRNLNTIAGYKANGSSVPGMDKRDSTLSSSSNYYFVRSTDIDADYVKISIVSDPTYEGKIQVETDSEVLGGSDIRYAIPARCDVDIVLAVPVNGAASNENNRDSASVTAENPITYTSASLPNSVKNTPIYQMGQACKNFVKDNFYHVRGVTMGLIPYSGKLSISPDRAESWTVSFPQFVDTSINTQLMIGACLYGTQGQKGQPLKRSMITTTIKNGTSITAPYYWGGLQHGCPIMFRRGTVIGSYGGNSYYGGYSGYLLNTTDPSTNNDYKYLRMNLNPCTIGYANQLTMKCENACTYFTANPYYVIEPTSDLVKIYEMCNALRPFYDTKNVSNFVFLPFEWANNFWQSWTNANKPSTPETTGSEDNAVLKRGAKTFGRKKVLILLVNKPDWFEPEEMTYLGFDNDYSEISVVESDKIDFSINYSDTSKKYLDGTSYDGTPRGPKKFIRYVTQSGTISRNSSGIFECVNSGRGRLYIPRRGTVRLTVKNRVGGDIRSGNLNWKYLPQALNANGPACSTWGGSGIWTGKGIAYKGGRFVTKSSEVPCYTAYSDDGINWYRGNTLSNAMKQITANSSTFLGAKSGIIFYSTDGINWSETTSSGYPTGIMDDDLCWDGSRFFAVLDGGPIYITKSGSGTSDWYKLGNRGSGYIIDQEQFKYGGGYYLQKTYTGSCIRYSTDVLLNDYTEVNLPISGRVAALHYGPGYWVVFTQYGDVMCSTDAKGSSWSIVDGSSSNTSSSSLYKLSEKTDWYNICYGGGKWVAVSYLGDVAVLEDSTPGTLRFANVNDSRTYTIKGEKTFTISAANITSMMGNEYYIDFDVSNLRLVSAEVTNAIVDTSQNVINPVDVTYDDTEYSGGSNDSGATIETLSENIEDGIKTIRIKSKKLSTVSVALRKYTKIKPTSWDFTKWTQGGSFSNVYNSDVWYCYNFAFDGSKFIIWHPGVGYVGYSSDSTTWSSYGQGLSSIAGSREGGIGYGNDTYVAISTVGDVATSSNGSSWNKKESQLKAIHDSGWTGIVYGKSKFVATTSKGYVATSGDGSSWTSMGLVLGSSDIRSIAFGKDKFVALGDAVTHTSTDARSWTKSTSIANIRSSYWRGIAYGADYFVAVNGNGDVAYSKDGVNWTSAGKPIPSGENRFICFGKNRFVVIYRQTGESFYCTPTGTNIQPYYKIDSAAQVNVNTDTNISVSLSSIDSSGNYYVDVKLCCLDVQSCVVLYSSSEQGRAGSLSFSTLSNDVVNGIQTVRLKSSKSGTATLYLEKYQKTRSGGFDISKLNKWTKGGSLKGFSNDWRCANLAYDGRNFVVWSGTTGHVAYSTDGISWLSSGSQLSSMTTTWGAVAYGKGIYTAISNLSHVATASNLSSWTYQGDILRSIYHGQWNALCYDGAKFVAMCCYSPGYLATSTNGISWNSIEQTNGSSLSNISGSYWYSIVYGNNKYVAISTQGHSAYSRDLISWTKSSTQLSSITNEWRGVTYGEGIFVATNHLGYVAYSYDGDTWISVGQPLYSINSNNGWWGVCYGQGRLITVHYSSGDTAYCEVGGTTTIVPYYQIGSSSQVYVNSNATISVSLSSRDSNGDYYADVTLCCLNIKSSALTYSDTKLVDDLIPFYNNNTSSKNNSQRTLTYSGTSGIHLSGGLYYRTGSGTITLANRGKLKLKIMPNLVTQSGTFAFTTGNDKNIKTVTGIEEYTIEIDQQEVSGRQYQVSFDMKNIVLITAEFISETAQVDPLNITLPNSTRSAYIDFSQINASKPYYSNRSYFTFGSNIGGTIPSGTAYDSELERWCTTSGINKFYDQSLKNKGLVWLITEDFSDSAAVKNLYYSTNATSNSTSQISTYMPGLVRTTYTADQAWNYLGIQTTNSKKTILTAAGVTLPINAALYAKYGRIDSNEGLKQLMKDACSKLKTDHGVDNTRIYVIKFREQTSHAERVRNGEGMTRASVNNDYSYFNACTSYIYSATQANLTDKLNAIADDIKSWAGYQKARNVD